MLFENFIAAVFDFRQNVFKFLGFVVVRTCNGNGDISDFQTVFNGGFDVLYNLVQFIGHNLIGLSYNKVYGHFVKFKLTEKIQNAFPYSTLVRTYTNHIRKAFREILVNGSVVKFKTRIKAGHIDYFNSRYYFEKIIVKRHLHKTNVFYGKLFCVKLVNRAF